MHTPHTHITHTHTHHTHTYHVTWKKLLHIPASHPIHTPVLLNPSSSHSWQACWKKGRREGGGKVTIIHILTKYTFTFAPHFPAASVSNVTPLSKSGSTYSIPGVYKLQTTCTHLWNGMGYCGMEWNCCGMEWNGYRKGKDHLYIPDEIVVEWNGMVTEKEKITSIYQMRLCLTVHLLSV